MSKKTRKILFLICLFLFILMAPLAILYSQGYRFDLNPTDGGIKITQTGGIFIKTEPKQAEIYINNELIKKTDFFFGSALIENLLPKKYKIEVKKENYLSWEKNLEVREREVAEVKNIILFPENINFNPLTSDQKNETVVKNFWFSSDKKILILLEEENSDPEKDKKSWALKLYNPAKNIKSHLISEADIYQQGASLENLEFSEDSNEIYLEVEIYDNSTRLDLSSSATENQRKTFILKLDKLPPQITEKKTIPLPEDIIISKKNNQDVYYLDKFGYLLKNDLKINEKPFPIESELKYTIEIFSDLIFLITAKSSDLFSEANVPYLKNRELNLYLFSPELKSFESLSEKINGLEVSPDERKMVFFSNSEVWVIFLKDDGSRKAGDRLFISRLSEKIGNALWLNSDYLFFNSGNNLKIAELDDRDRIQIWDINTSANFNAAIKINFNENNKNLYILDRGSLFVSEKIF